MVGIALVVPDGNGRSFLTKALKGLRQQTKEYHYLYLWPIQGTRRCGAGLSVFDEGSPSFPDQDDFWHPRSCSRRLAPYPVIPPKTQLCAMGMPFSPQGKNTVCIRPSSHLCGCPSYKC